ncbi:hypothetical protein MKQ70_12650 [Chitinophaga sedimenti]|uniref:hypothetical protein n=1 Tax=Chitinophaga sedimenti TaxID=2033606 RepID=UPI002003D201|nr:hypothetical protein [Chitinophaga sedimenti]MCK7555820.1 hypothetical protein [Chitinophaga sedimenti]
MKTAFFRHSIIVYLFSIALCAGFGLRAGLCVAGKWCMASIEMEDKFAAEKDKSAKEDKSGRPDKKMMYYDVPGAHPFSHLRTATEAHNRVYLLAIITAPLIPVPIEPPEFA